MNIKQYPLNSGQWYEEKTEKKWIIWHGTEGRTSKTPANGKPGLATTSIDGWNADNLHIGAPWLVDRDGTIYQTFDDSEWIYHLGLKGTDGAYDKASVAIEFAYDHPKCFELATIICHYNCRKDKEDLMLEDWIWEKIRTAGISIVTHKS